ncbi:MAG: phosphate acyltransferase [Verrucomicrobiota bacterium]
MRYIETVFEKLRRHPKRVVFTEGTEPRVLHAASRFAQLQLGAPVVLGKRLEIEAIALQEKIDIDHIGIIDPSTSSELPAFISRLEKLKRYHNLGPDAATQLLSNPHYFAAMMVQYALVDGLITGARETASSSLRPLIQLIKPLPTTSSISSCMMLDLSHPRHGERGVMFFADCAVIPEPSVEQLAEIAVQTGTICRQMTGNKPRIAMLSFSTKSSADLASPRKMAAATALARQKIRDQRLEMEVDGELQADTALLTELAHRKAPHSLVAGHANVLIFPDLNSGNISSKLVQHLAGAETYGQILLGLTKPCADLSRGASIENILGVAAIIGLQAIDFRNLYPDLA